MYISRALLLDDSESENRNEQNDNTIDIRQFKINYVKLGQLLTELGFLPVNMTPDSVERELLFDMWNLLKGEQNNGITINNLRKVLLVVEGLSAPDEKDKMNN